VVTRQKTEGAKDDSPALVIQKHVKPEGVVTNPGKGDLTLPVESRAWVAWR
jgi:hypothetical protein